MWRYLIGAVAALALAGAGLLFFRGDARPGAVLPALAASSPQAGAGANDPLPDRAPEATERTREQKRFDRYDKDRDGKVTREEYLAARRKAFAKLDANHDGQLSFDEWAVKAEAKFAGADADHSGAMTPAEFAATAAKRSNRARVKCAPAAAPAAAADDS
ncbi:MULTISPECIES: EF-hand domain-containing protein [unclassified Sphingomonas]|uniref:EF-hand domain-containing protein n=1 Tax=unclassified Sphingomonas TaxID=196159 RepID=UPI001F5914A9|nr:MULTISPECIES: EF-hand domain-containing protein [unclassified Sphingomonas]